MLPSSLFTIVYLCSTLHEVISIIDCSRYEFPADRKQQTNCIRYTPIALYTSAAKVISAPKLQITVCNEVRMNCTNTGRSVRFLVPQGFVNLTGGPVYKDRYYLNNVVLRYDIVPNKTRAIGLQDEGGTGVGVELAFYNYAYPPESNYSDSQLRMLFHVEVNGNAPNLKFERFAVSVLKNIREYNTTVSLPAKNFLPWIFETLSPPYYVYPGSSRSTDGLTFVPNCIWMESSYRIHPFISYYQYYEYLLKLKNEVGQPLEGVLSLFPVGNRPVVEIQDGVKVKYRHKCRYGKYEYSRCG